MIRRFWIVPVLFLIVGLMAGQAVAKEKKAKAFLGIVPAELTSDLAADYGITGGPGSGVVVDGVTSDSPASKIGLRENDVIVKINGINITGPEELRTQLAKYKPGDKVDLTYVRGGKERTEKVELADKHEFTETWDMGDLKIWGDDKKLKIKAPRIEWHSQEKGEKYAFAGIVTQELSEGLADYFKVEKGVLISEVVEDSPAAKDGLKAGDVILKIAGEEVEDEGDVRSVIRDQKVGDKVDFIIKRDGKEMTVPVTLGEREYGLLKDPDSRIFFDGEMFPLTISDDGISVIEIPSSEDLKDIEEDLREIEIELKDLDLEKKLEQLELNATPLWPAKPDITAVQTIRYEGGWRATLQRFQDDVMDAVMILQEKVQDMKMKILELKEEIIKAMA